MDSHDRHSAKSQVRASITAYRRELTSADLQISDAMRTSRVLSRLRMINPQVVACYASQGHEPGTRELLVALRDMAVRVLLPALAPDVTEPRWTWWTQEPTTFTSKGFLASATPLFNSQVLTQADVIIVPGLAGTRHGVRLGRGGGWYDRALAHTRSKTPRWLLLHDTEVLDQVPSDIWDQPATALVTEQRWIDCSR